MEGTPSVPLLLLFFCPSCAPVVLEQEKREKP
jgi:hypothetical protein